MDTEFEVKKLKDLVKKLERQNQHLRYKTGKLGPGHQTKSPSERLSSADDILTGYVNDDHAETYVTKIPDGSETLWLFAHGKSTVTENSESLEDWLRHDLEHPQTASLAYARNEIVSCLNNACKSNDQSAAIESQLSKLAVEEPIEVNDGKTEDYFEEKEPVQLSAVHHMPLPSHTMTSIHGLIESESRAEFKSMSQSPASKSHKHQTSSENHTNTQVSQRYRRRSPSPSTGRSPSRSSINKGISNPNFNASEKKSVPKQIPRPSSPARTAMTATKEDTPSRGRRGIPSLYQHSPRLTKLPSSTLERRLGTESKYGNNSEQFSQLSNTGLPLTPEVNLEFRGAKENFKKTSYMSPNRRPLPRPSHSSKIQYSNFSSKYTKEHSPRSSTQQRPSPAQSTESLSESSDVWNDGEFF